MLLLKTSLIRKTIIYLLSAMLSVSAMAASDFDLPVIERLANQGNLSAQIVVGMKYHEGEDVRQDFSKSAYWFEKAAKQNNALSQYFLGSQYYYGRGVRQDFSKALYWYQKAADQNESVAQFYLGYMYFSGTAVRQNTSKAKEWFGKSCDNGFQSGCDGYRELNQLTR